MSDKLKFKSLGEFLTALEESSLYDELGKEYRLVTNISSLTVAEYNERGDCLGCNSSLLAVQKIGLTHTFTRKPLPKDKDLVWCWDDHYVSGRIVCFYDALNRRTFGSLGERRGLEGSHYEVIEPNSEGLYEAPFEWANEVKKKLAK